MMMIYSGWNLTTILNKRINFWEQIFFPEYILLFIFLLDIQKKKWCTNATICNFPETTTWYGVDVRIAIQHFLEIHWTKEFQKFHILLYLLAQQLATIFLSVSHAVNARLTRENQKIPVRLFPFQLFLVYQENHER